MSILIIYGEKGSGKTTNAERLRAHFGCKRVVDDWIPGDQLRDGDMALTCDDGCFGYKKAQVVTLTAALKQLFPAQEVSA